MGVSGACMKLPHINKHWRSGPGKLLHVSHPNPHVPPRFIAQGSPGGGGGGGVGLVRE